MYLSFSVSVNKYIRKVYRKYQQADIPKPVYDYNWSAEKGRDHYYTQIARDLIDKIAASIYEPGTLLPYEAVLAKNYKVSISTIRKSLALLNEIGFAETINTKGTIVRLPPYFHHRQLYAERALQKRYADLSQRLAANVSYYQACCHGRS